MSNENLNDFYNQNRFNKKLRERIDAYEPELSDSLWDRIEHDLVQKESKGKRAIWMVYLLAGLLLVSGVGIYYLASENKKLADTVKEISAEQESPVPFYSMPETTVEVERHVNSPAAPETPAETSNELALGAQIPNSAVQNPRSYVVPAQVAENPVIEETVVPIQTVQVSPAEGDIAEIEVAELPFAAQIESLTPAAFKYAPKTLFPVALKESQKKSELIYPLVSSYFGLVAEMGSNRQVVSGSFAGKFQIEHPGFFRALGFKTGVLVRNGWYIESGVNFTESQTNLWYDSIPVKKPGPVPQGIDTIVVGNAAHIVNSQRWVEIPLRLGYLYPINSKLAINGNVGMTYSAINRSSGEQINPDFYGFDDYSILKIQPFKSYWSFQSSLGLSYGIGRNWAIDVQANYRRGLQNMNALEGPNHPDRKAEILSGSFGLRYLLR